MVHGLWFIEKSFFELWFFYLMLKDRNHLGDDFRFQWYFALSKVCIRHNTYIYIYSCCIFLCLPFSISRWWALILYYFNLACIAHEYFHAENFVKISHICSLNTRNNAIYLHFNKTPKLVSSYKKPSIAATMIWNTLPVEIRMIKGKSNLRPNLRNITSNMYKKLSWSELIN